MSSTAPESKRPQDSDFYQQRLKAWQPILTPKWVIISFTLVGVIFLPLGFVLKAASDSVVEVSVQYDGKSAVTDPAIAGSCHIGPDEFPVFGDKSCSIQITVPEKMEGPVYLYYELDNFYQNHRRYVKSRSDDQLNGDFPSAPTSDCDPLKKRGDRTLWPCGLIANSMFNDTIALSSPPAGVSLDETGIAWKSDRDSKFKNVPKATKDANRADYVFLDEIYPGVIPNDGSVNSGVENEHFIVWMRTAALPNFRKLYGRIDSTLDEGTVLTFQISANFKVSSFDGKKSLVLSTTSWLGGKNPFLGIAYMVVGALCLCLALGFFVKHKVSGRELGDTNLLVWNVPS